jgi:heptosyltransferase II
LQPPKKIIVRGVNWLGDAVMTTPALQRLREAYPGVTITLVTPLKLADLWKHHPCVDDLLTFAKGETIFQVGRRIRWGNFDLGIVFPNSPRSAIELWWGKVPRRFGYARPWRNFFLSDRVGEPDDLPKMRKRSVGEIKRLVATPVQQLRIPPEAHHAHHYLRLVAAVGADPTPLPPLLHVTPEEVALFTKRFGVTYSREPVFGLNPGAEYGPAKRWPADRFITAAVDLHKQVGCRWIIFGGLAEKPLADEIAAGIRNALGAGAEGMVVNAAGETTLRELCAGLKTCRLLITNDTGPMHVAAALGTPVIVPFGSTSPELTGPGLPGETRHALIKSTAGCSPCFLRECPIDFRCMQTIEPKMVVEAAQRAFSPAL